MPDLTKLEIDDIEQRLGRYLLARQGYHSPQFLAAGGSAAVFAIQTPYGERVIKGYDPALFTDGRKNAEVRRLEIQRRLIGHKCQSLVSTYSVEEAEGTAFIEMEFVSWPRLSAVVASVPDEGVPVLISQLVSATKFLEAEKIVHRDIKPENINVAPDFSALKLLDLGVARELDQLEDLGDSATDHGNLRPFLATAQYSSPEYLFRLEPPSPKLWQGLSIYQVGAVLHDLIMKRPLFQQEISIGNRWILAKSVLTKAPTFVDAKSSRLSQWKSLASRCLTKDLESRLQLVSWLDFQAHSATEMLPALKQRLENRERAGESYSKLLADGRLNFDRSELLRRIKDQVRDELVAVCGRKLPLTARSCAPDFPNRIEILFALRQDLTLRSTIEFSWGAGLYERSANVEVTASLTADASTKDRVQGKGRLAGVVVMHENEKDLVVSVCDVLATAIGHALDLIDAGEPNDALFDLDILENRGAETTVK
jgi:eukaryotic-like serine/threonine-protein kinase